jgi:hypothetical protein
LKVHISGVGRVVALAAMVLKCQADNCERSEQNPKHEKSKYAIAVFEISSDNVENLLGLVGNTSHCVWIVVEL